MSSKNNSNLNTSEKYANLGDIYAQEKNWDLAIENYSQAIVLEPKISWYYYHLAQALSQKRNWNKAIKNYYHAIELNHNFFCEPKKALQHLTIFCILHIYNEYHGLRGSRISWRLYSLC